MEQQCKKCQGTGWILRDTPYICPGIHTPGVISCMLCENVQKGNYETCDKCNGSGEIMNKNIEMTR